MTERARDEWLESVEAEVRYGGQIGAHDALGLMNAVRELRAECHAARAAFVSRSRSDTTGPDVPLDGNVAEWVQEQLRNAAELFHRLSVGNVAEAREAAAALHGVPFELLAEIWPVARAMLVRLHETESVAQWRVITGNGRSNEGAP